MSPLFRARLAGIALALYSLTCAAVDVPPTVTSTVPADGATNVAASANIVINFSEPVTVDAGWYDISCGTSGAHLAAQTGGPSSYTLNPSVDFTPAEDCTVSIDGSLVHDQDGAADPMANNVRFMFTVTAGDTIFKDGFE